MGLTRMPVVLWFELGGTGCEPRFSDSMFNVL